MLVDPRAGPQIPAPHLPRICVRSRDRRSFPPRAFEAIPMTSLLYRAIAAIRAWLGLNDPAENRLHPSHGWLLPTVATVRARGSEPLPGERR